MVRQLFSQKLFISVHFFFFSSRGSPATITSHSMWDLWWTDWHCDRVLVEYFDFFRQCSIFLFLFISLPLTLYNINSSEHHWIKHAYPFFLFRFFIFFVSRVFEFLSFELGILKQSDINIYYQYLFSIYTATSFGLIILRHSQAMVKNVHRRNWRNVYKIVKMKIEISTVRLCYSRTMFRIQMLCEMTFSFL